ncbi:MAG: 6-bladed beta-propeller [Lachnoclostridium sp.]|jgi:hypothetical protein|nr:6-bladed beta-propeller [Lachnoclostridium sp.]
MNYRSFILSICCAILLLACGQKSEQPTDAVEVNFHDYVEKPISENGGDYYSEKQYIVLSSDQKNMMLSHITNVVLKNDKMYIADSRTRNLIVYDMNGRVIAKVGNRGRGPGEYITLTGFDVDNNGCIHVIDGNTDRLLRYNDDYQFVDAKKLPFEVDLIKCMQDGGYLFGLSAWDSSQYGGTRIIRTTQQLTVLNETGTYDKKLIDNNIQFSPFYFIETHDGIFYHMSIDDNVYMLDCDGNIKKTYYFNFGNRRIPMKHRSNLEPFMKSGEIASYQAIINFAVPWGKWIFGILYDRGDPKSFVYDTNTNVAYTYAKEEGIYTMISNGYLIMYFPFINGENLPEDIPDNMHKHVIDGDMLLCLYKLK